MSREPTIPSETVVGSSTVQTGTDPVIKLKVVQIPDRAAPPALPLGYSLIDDLVGELTSTVDGAAAVQVARAEYAADVRAVEGFTMRARRLELGLSQKQLAELVGTKQPHIARIEAGTENLQISTMRRLAVALEVDMNTMNAMLERQEQVGNEGLN